MKKDIRTLLDLTGDDFDRLIHRAVELKKEPSESRRRPLDGKILGLIFEKPSTRTRVSFEAAMIHLGGSPLFISSKDSQISRSEPVRDTARVLSGYLDALAIRTYSQDLLEEFAEFASIPVINALTDMYHPCQVLSDLMTVVEHKGGYKDIKIAWIGDGNNVANSWINAASKLPLDLWLACPEGHRPMPSIMDRIKRQNRDNIHLVARPVEAVEGAAVVYTDVWVSMGQESESLSRKKVFENFQVNEKLLTVAAEDAIVMHCLPAHRGEEIEEAVLEGRRSVVWDQSENKMHMHKAVLEALMGDRGRSRQSA